MQIRLVEASFVASKHPNHSNELKPRPHFILRAIVAGVLCVLVILYTVAVMSGLLGAERKIDAVNLAMIVVALVTAAVLLIPEELERLKLFEFAGFRLAMRRVRKVEKRVSDQEKRITELLMISMSTPIFRHLCGIACLKEYLYRHFDLFRREIYYLKDNGFIRSKPGHERVEFDRRFKDKNLVDVAEPTDAGWEVIRLRMKDIPEDLKRDEGNLNRNIPQDILDAMLTKS
jgi:hypothetical protein